MRNRWIEAEASDFQAKWAPTCGEDLAIRTYSSRLLGADPSLVLHGGGNTSVKTVRQDRFGNPLETICVKASGYDMRTIPPEGHTALLLQPVRRLLAARFMTEQEMVDELRRHLWDWRAATPSIETLMHAAIPSKFVDHTHADAILILTNQDEADRLLPDILGETIGVVPYVKAGFDLALAVNHRLAKSPQCQALVLLQHGLVTWGDQARESYERTVEIVNRAESFLENRRSRVFMATRGATDAAHQQYAELAPVVRGSLALSNSDPDHPYDRFILRHLGDAETLGLIELESAKDLLLTAPLTPDHLIRTKPLPLWVDQADYSDPELFRDQIIKAIEGYKRDYEQYLTRHGHRLPQGIGPLDPVPRVLILPGLGVICAGENVQSACIARDITAQTLRAKAWFAATGCHYAGLSEDHLFDMEYFPLQHAKLLAKPKGGALSRQVALVTGAAGAIGLGICESLLGQGCQVVVTDLPGEALDTAVRALSERSASKVIGVPMDVTDPASVQAGFRAAVLEWGGLDLVVVNAGIAMVSSLADMSLDGFRRLERVNIEGTLLVLAECARHFKLQGTGGDIVLVSTKNVFAPGAKFGAYSATKAASHQLARIASLELAELGVRVNMVAPDAVFSHGARKSGLWAEVGPDRMKARGLDEKGLEEYYRSRNLLKARVTAEHVGNAVLYFATRQTPTTGATIPVDGGLPDSTPR